MDCSDFNRLLDGYIDGKLDEAQLIELKQHAEDCIKCREELAASEQLRDILSHMNDDISVPLPAQAAWRKAVKAEAHRRRMKRVYSACTAAAALFVLTVGVTAMFKQENADLLSQNSPRVETDGIGESAVTAEAVQPDMALMSTRVRSVEYIECGIVSDDPAKAYGYLCDVIAEYGGMIESESDGEERRVFLQIPGENAVDFLNAVVSIGDADDSAVYAVDEAAASVGICVTITGA